MQTFNQPCSWCLYQTESPTASGGRAPAPLGALLPAAMGETELETLRAASPLSCAAVATAGAATSSGCSSEAGSWAGIGCASLELPAPFDAAASSRDSHDVRPPWRRSPKLIAFRPVVVDQTPLLCSWRRALRTASSASPPAVRGDVREEDDGVGTSTGSPHGANSGGPPRGTKWVIGALHFGHPLPDSGFRIAACAMSELAWGPLARWRCSELNQPKRQLR